MIVEVVVETVTVVEVLPVIRLTVRVNKGRLRSLRTKRLKGPF